MKRMGWMLTAVMVLIAATACMCVVGGSAYAGWTVVSLHPAGAHSSRAYGISGGKQAGYAIIGGNNHASLWSGTAASWVDLHALLPAGAYSQSEAQSVDVSAGDIWVAGFATDISTGRDHAMLWHYTAEAPPK
jgi:hypothetical protein